MDDEKVYKATAYFSEDAFEAFMRGDAVDNNGFRSTNGTFYPDQPSFDFDDDDDEEDDDDFDEGFSAEDAAAAAILVGLGMAIAHFGPKIWKWAKKKFNKGGKEIIEEPVTEESSGDNSNSTETSLWTVKYSSEEFEDRFVSSLENYQKDPTDKDYTEHLKKAFLCMVMAREEIDKYADEVVAAHPEFHENIEGWKKLLKHYTAENIEKYLDILNNQEEKISPEELQELLSSKSENAVLEFKKPSA